MLVPIALAVSAALAFGATAASAKAGSGAVKSAAKCATTLNTALDKKDGVGAGWLARAIACSRTNPMKAKGGAVKIGFLNPEGAVINFPEYRISAEAAVKYINTELGGIGADPATGTPGVPIKLVECKYNALAAAELGNCANTLAAAKPAVVFASLAFGDAHIKIFQDTKTPLIVGTPIFPGDFTSAGVYAIGGGGGCLGVHLGLIYFATQTLKLNKVALPWAASAPGIFCYNDLEAKPLDILAGQSRSGAAITTSSKLLGTMKGLTYLPIAVPTSNPDVAAYAAQIMAFKPNVLVYSNQGNLCWDLMDKLIANGWTTSSFPIVFSGSCIDTATMTKLGSKINGLYTIGGMSILDPDALTGAAKSDALTYGTKMYTYSSDRKLSGTGFATQGFSAMMVLWQIASESVKAGKVTGAAMVKTLKATNGHRAFGSTGLFCKQAIAPYVAVCATQVSASQWDGTALKAVKTSQNFSGLALVGKGDPLRTSELK
jgi:branched-chain amino acid transport system substrate-binding protein